MSRDYREKTVNGWITDGKNLKFTPITVRMTSDNKGQSLSLSAEDKDILIQLGIPLESVRDIVKVVDK